MKLAIAVHGRWDAFDIARELVGRGHDVRLLTNYPTRVVQRWGVPSRCVSSFWPHGVTSRLAARVGLERRLEAQLHIVFGHWVADRLRGRRWDAVFLFSGIAQEGLYASKGQSNLRVLIRESAHIRAQDRLLSEEELRTGAPQDRPSAWRIAREEREYALADTIRVLSTFSLQSFLGEGVPSSKMKLLLSGADLQKFRATESAVEARRARLLSGAPLRVLTVGTFAFRKGVWDTAEVIRRMSGDTIEFRFVGPILPEASALARELQGLATFVPKQPEHTLPEQYAWGDVFLMPSIEDGYQAVMAQAAASALPILTTPNGAGYDLVRDDQNGWVVPIRSPHALIDRLGWANTHRAELAALVQDSYRQFRPRGFADVAEDLEELVRSMAARRAPAESAA